MKKRMKVEFMMWVDFLGYDKAVNEITVSEYGIMRFYNSKGAEFHTADADDVEGIRLHPWCSPFVYNLARSLAKNYKSYRENLKEWEKDIIKYLDERELVDE